ncbi:hypothetical protein PHISCL_09343 [Aspergillus sclerotialis]|uniref:Uncharacterized protein n=1 Tax=Aspergillus sclerotialis TaxID=2070753 RepID=A0A3A2Z659_9EURO|nr:hypothetical protein PHISCL_09343 [Aspergillus sclerotialis]
MSRLYLDPEAVRQFLDEVVTSIRGCLNRACVKPYIRIFVMWIIKRGMEQLHCIYRTLYDRLTQPSLPVSKLSIYLSSLEVTTVCDVATDNACNP